MKKSTKITTNPPKKTELGFLEAQLLQACKVVTSYTTDLLYRLDDQVELSDVEELQQARDVINRCSISEQCSELPGKKIPVNIMVDHGKLWIQPVGYSDKTSSDGHGWPIGMEIWEGRLRLIIFDDINTEDPRIIDLENARECSRDDERINTISVF